MSVTILKEENIVPKAFLLYISAIFISMPPLNVPFSIEVKIDFGSS
jgi:hypothetical protein